VEAGRFGPQLCDRDDADGPVPKLRDFEGNVKGEAGASGAKAPFFLRDLCRGSRLYRPAEGGRPDPRNQRLFPRPVKPCPDEKRSCHRKSREIECLRHGFRLEARRRAGRARRGWRKRKSISQKPKRDEAGGGSRCGGERDRSARHRERRG